MLECCEQGLFGGCKVFRVGVKDVDESCKGGGKGDVVGVSSVCKRGCLLFSEWHEEGA